MDVTSLFTGVGGLDLGLERAGMRTVAQVEIDPYARQVLEKHWPDVPRWEDVRDVGAATLPDADVLVGGFPCQDVSVAGARAGLDGDRSGLWFEFARVIRETAPRWVLIENVPGLLSSNGGRDLGTVLGFLGEHGFRWAYRVLDSQWFGVAQRRRRVFIVASRTAGSPVEVLFEPESSEGNPPTRGEAGTIHSGGLARSIGAVGVGNDYGANKGTLVVEGVELTGDVRVPLRTAGGHGAPAIIPFAQNTRDEVRIVGDDDGAHVSGALSAHAGMKQTTYLWEADRRDGIRVHDDVTPTLQSYMGTGGNNVPMAGVRRLTPVECERLQGFPDGWSSDIVSDSQAYKQMGNAVTVPVAEWIGTRLLAEDRARKNAPAAADPVD